MKFKRFSLLLLFFLSFSIGAFAQSLSDIDFENINIDNLSDQQIQQIKAEAENRGLSISQIEQLAIAQGMPQTQATKLRQRLNEAGGRSFQTDEGDVSGRLRYAQPDTSQARFFDNLLGGDSIRDSLRLNQNIEYVRYQTRQDSLELERKKLRDKIFGFELFDNGSGSFEPELNIPTPTDYQLGPGDQLIIDIWGAAETNYQLEVSPDGMISIDNVGPIQVNGLSIEEVSKRLKERLGEIYSGLNPSDQANKDTYMQVSLGQVRSIKVTVIGEVIQPGSYTLPSLATVFNALYNSGGPSVSGSFREIQVIRGDSIATTFDLYDLLINSDQSDNIRLRSQDIIKVSPYINRVEVEGEVKREGIYETKEDESLTNLLRYTGGFTGDAYTHRIKIIGNTSRQKTINDITEANFDNYELNNGDYVTVGKVLDRFTNLVEIEGAVFREGQYALTDTSTVSSLITRADGLRGDAFQNRGLIYREEDDYTLKTIPFNVLEVVNNPDSDIKLEKNDLVLISSIHDMREDYFIEIEGPVQNPDKYKFADDMTLEDIILQAGGFRRGATPNHIEVARRKTDGDDEQYETSQIAEVFRFNIDENLELDPEGSDFDLKPFDKVYVRTLPNYTQQKDVVVSGEVKYPGTYSLETKNDRISDIIERAGGLTAEAYTQGASLYRTLREDELARTTDEDELQGFFVTDGDTLQRDQEENNQRTISKIGINLPDIVSNPGSRYDLYLEEADSLYIPKQLQTVTVEGGVFYPRSIRYQEGMNYKDYITSAGGFTDLAKDNKSYIIYANGDVKRVRKFLFFRNYPEVEPGAKLVVPEKPEDAKLSPQERISILSAITSTAALIVTTIVQVSR